jgi:hypothetical protein
MKNEAWGVENEFIMQMQMQILSCTLYPNVVKLRAKPCKH